MAYYRFSLAILAGIFLVVGAAMWIEASDRNMMFAGILVRVGVVLCVTAIAFPQIHVLRGRTSILVISIAFVLLLVVAARPKLFPISFVIALAVILANGILRRFSGKRVS